MNRQEIIVALIPGLVEAALHKQQWQFAPKPTLASVESEVLESANRIADKMLQLEPQALDLCDSEAACQAADAWAVECNIAGRSFSDPHREALDRLERMTRPSKLRKVRS